MAAATHADKNDLIRSRADKNELIRSRADTNYLIRSRADQNDLIRSRAEESKGRSLQAARANRLQDQDQDEVTQGATTIGPERYERKTNIKI